MSDFHFRAWPTESRLITQHFGERPEYYAQFGLAGHEGVDFAATVGSNVSCVANGVASTQRIFARLDVSLGALPAQPLAESLTLASLGVANHAYRAQMAHLTIESMSRMIDTKYNGFR